MASPSDPWVRTATTVIARSLTSFQRGASAAIREAAARSTVAVDLVAPRPALCPGFSERSGKPDLAVDPSFYDPAAVLESLRMVDPDVLAEALVRAFTAETVVQWDVRGSDLVAPIRTWLTRIHARLAARIRDRINGYLSHKPNPLLIVPCLGVPVSQMSVTVTVARDLALDAVTFIRSTDEYAALEEASGRGVSDEYESGKTCWVGVSWWFVVILVLIAVIVYLWLQRAAVSQACRRFTHTVTSRAWAPPVDGNFFFDHRSPTM